MRLKSLWIFFYSLKEILAAAFKNKIQSSFSKVKNSYLEKASFKSTMFGCFIIQSTLISLIKVFFTVSSSSVSLNFLIATSIIEFYHILQFLYSFLCKQFRKHLH